MSKSICKAILKGLGNGLYIDKVMKSFYRYFYKSSTYTPTQRDYHCLAYLASNIKRT